MIFFGALVPIILDSQAGLMLPVVFAAGTAAPVVVWALAMSAGQGLADKWVRRVRTLDRYVRWGAAAVFVMSDMAAGHMPTGGRNGQNDAMAPVKADSLPAIITMPSSTVRPPENAAISPAPPWGSVKVVLLILVGCGDDDELFRQDGRPFLLAIGLVAGWLLIRPGSIVVAGVTAVIVAHAAHHQQVHQGAEEQHAVPKEILGAPRPQEVGAADHHDTAPRPHQPFV